MFLIILIHVAPTLRKLLINDVFFQIGKKVSKFVSSLGTKLQEQGVFGTWMLREQDQVWLKGKQYVNQGSQYEVFVQNVTNHTKITFELQKYFF